MRTLALWIDRHPKKILAAVFLLTALVAMGLPRIKFARSIDEGDLPEASQMLIALKSVSTIFGDDSRRVFVTLSSKDGNQKVTQPEILKVIADLSAAIRGIPFVKKSAVVSLTSVKQIETSGRDGSLVIGPAVRGKTPEEIESSIAGNPNLYGRLVSKDFGTTLIIAPVTADAEITKVHQEFAQILDRYSARVPGLKLGILGDPEILYQLNKSIERDILLFVSLSILLTLIAFYLVFRSWQGVVQPIAVIVTSIVWTMGFVGFWGEPITLISATLPVVLVIMAGSYAVHVYHHLLEEEKHTGSFVAGVSRLFREQASPLFMAMITTFLGGLSLLTFKIRPLQHFGVFTAWGSLISLILTVLIVPSLHRVIKGTQAAHEIPEGPRTPVERALSAVSRFATRFPRQALLGSLLVVIVSGVLLMKIRIGFDAVALFPSDHPVRVTAENMDRAFGGTRSFEIAIDSGRAGGAAQPDFLERIRRFEAECRKIPIVSRTFSVAHLIDQAHQALAPPEMLRENLTTNQVAQYLLLLSMSDAEFPIRSFITPDRRYAKASFTLDSTRTADFLDAYLKINAIAKDVFDPVTRVLVGGRPMFSVAMQQYLVWGKVQNVFSTILTLILLLLFRYRSVARALVTSIPLGVAILATFGLMGLLGIQLDYVSATITSFAMGMGSDFAIHLVSAIRKEHKSTKDIAKACEIAASGPGKVILYNAGCTVLGFSVMIFSRFNTLRTFSLLICFNMGVILIFTLLMIPAIFALYRPRFAYPYGKFSVTRTEWLWGAVVFVSLLAAILLTERLV